MKMEVVCIARNERFKHHRKLIIGGKYSASVIDGSTITIYGLVNNHTSGFFIGCYDANMFIDVSKFRDDQINKLLEI